MRALWKVLMKAAQMGCEFLPETIGYFIAAAEAGRFPRAAVELDVSQSAVTAAIQQLEAVLDLRLFTATRQAFRSRREGRASFSTLAM